MFAFERCVDSNLSDPLKQAIRDLLTRIRGGMQPDEALAYFQKFSPQEHFQDLIFAVRFNFRHRGNLPTMLELMEIQQNKLEEAYNERSISNRADLMIASGLLLAVPFLFGWRMLADQAARDLFLGSPIGFGLLAASVLCYGVAVAWFIHLFRLIRD
jgi:Flp pilus assembly protein TadB